MKNIIRLLIIGFVTISTAVTLAVGLFTIILSPDVSFGPEIFFQIILTGILMDLPLIIFYSKKEPSKKSMLIRQIVHPLVLIGILASLSFWFGWLDINKPIGFLFLFLEFSIIYVAVSSVLFLVSKREANKINIAIKRRQESRDKHIE